LKISLYRKAVLDNKTSNAVTWKDKEKTWSDIAVEFNSQTGGSVSINKLYRIHFFRYLNKMFILLLTIYYHYYLYSLAMETA